MFFQNALQKGFSLKTLITRPLSTSANLPKTILLQRLESRTFLKINGNEAEDYLQGLITNDIKHLHDGSPCVYALFLNSRGRVLYDSIIYKTKEPKTFLIECDASAADSLRKHLTMYRVRRKITVDPEENLKLWVIGTNRDTEDKENIKYVTESLKNSLNNCLVCMDPRIASLGSRILAPEEANVADLVKNVKEFEVSTENFYKSLRYRLGVGEGINELPPGNCLPLEANCDYLNGVSFHKGCYIGQELTARTYHTGVIRKRLMPISFDEKIETAENDAPIYASDRGEKSIGKLRGVEGNLGIGLLRIEEALRAPELTVLGKTSRTNRPFWWKHDVKDENFNSKEI